METAIALGYYISTAGFLVATVLMAMAVSKFGKSAFGSIMPYFLIGTATFLFVTIFQTLGSEFFRISDESMDVWWHILFYLALASYYLGLRALVDLGSGDVESNAKKSAMTWGIFSALLVALVFTLPASLESTVLAYDNSPLGQLGLHHFLAFILAAVVGSYLASIKKNLGQIGKAIASPMVIALWALALQHFWELLFESWNVVKVTTEAGEGGEKIFLTITAGCLAYVAIRLRSFAQG